MRRYAAKLLFQFRVVVDGDPGKRRLCEERILNFLARSPREAIQIANRRGKRAEHAYTNSDDHPVRFEFVGLLDVMGLGPEAADDEVWYDIRERLLPMERRERILPSQNDLLDRLTNASQAAEG